MNRFRLPHLAALAAVSLLASSAQAITTNWGALGPVAKVAFVTYDIPGAIDDFYTFTLSAADNVSAYGEEFESRSVSMSGATFQLFSGTPGSGAAIGSAFAFSNTPTVTLYANTGPGNFYFEVSGMALKADAAYDFEASAASPTQTSTVPEPASGALLLGGLVGLGFLSRRRQH